MEPLFLTPKKIFEKFASESQVPTNEAEWPAVILGELYKQAPYIEGSYVPEIIFKEKNPETGHAIGSIALSSMTTMSGDEAAGPAGAESGVKKIQIPFIIRDFHMAPLDLIVLPNGEFRPQNKVRIRDAMFRPGFTDGTAKGMRWNTWLDTLDRYPMGSLGQVYLESMNAQIVPYEKMSSLGEALRKKSGSLLTDLAPFDKSAYDQLTMELNHPFCVDRLLKMADFRSSIKKLARLAPGPGEKEAALAEKLPPTVVQVVRRPGAVYLVKKANTEAFEPTEEEVDRSEALNELGSNIVKAVDESGMVTISTSPTVREDLIEEKIEPVKNFGLYRVKSKGDGRQLLGWVFPRVVDVDGTALPMAIFSNGSENTVQPDIAGVRAGSAAGIISGVPQGTGIFYRVTGDDAVALVPMVVNVISKEGDLTKYEAATVMGKKIVLWATPGVAGIVPVPDAENEFVVPADMKFMPLPNDRHVDLIGDPEEFTKMNRLRRTSLTVYYDYGDQYSLKGCGMDKLADHEHIRVPPEQALFLMTAVGMHPSFAITKLAKVREAKVVTIPNLNPIVPLSEKMAISMAKLARSGWLDIVNKLPTPMWLAKEAALLGDVDSVDKILSLGFINPHNVAIFLSYTPDFERTLTRVCEVLFASRVGSNEELENAAERAMHGLENMISAMRLIGLESVAENESGAP